MSKPDTTPPSVGEILDNFATFFPWKPEDLKSRHYEQAITEATSQIEALILNARLEEWSLILGADPLSDIVINDVPDDFISVPGFWIKKRIATLKAELKEGK